jgi:DNA-binding NtrC family response regulator
MAVILVVEDEALILILATSYLEEQGHMTLTAGTLEQALALIDSDNEIDVLFTDIGLMDDPQAGLELAKQAVEWRPELKCSTRQAQAVWKGVGMRGIVSATPISRSWGTDLNRTGSLTAPDAPWGVCSH